MPKTSSESAKAVVVNGVPQQTGARSLDDLLSENGYQATAVATAVNGEFVSAGSRSGIMIAEGDHIEIVSARQGG